MRRLLIPLLAAAALAGCGGDDESDTVTVVQTTTAPPAETTAPVPETTPPAATETTPAPAPVVPEGLPADAVALSGRFTARVVDSEPATANASGTALGQEEQWTLTTSCTAGDCTLALRRKLQSGGYQDIELRPDDERPGLWFGELRTRAQCGAQRKAADSSITLRPIDPQGQVATSFEAYWRAEIECFRDDAAVSKYRGRSEEDGPA